MMIKSELAAVILYIQLDTLYHDNIMHSLIVAGLLRHYINHCTELSMI